MKEQIFNLFLEIEGDVILELSAVSHRMKGTDEQKLKFLQRNVLADLKNAKKYPVPERYRQLDVESGHSASGLKYSSYLLLAQQGRHLEVFEEIFEAMEGPADPLYCVTPIVDGEPKIEAVDLM